MASPANLLNCPKIIVDNEVKPPVQVLSVEFSWYSGDPHCFSPGLCPPRGARWGRELAALQPLLVLHGDALHPTGEQSATSHLQEALTSGPLHPSKSFEIRELRWTYSFRLSIDAIYELWIICIKWCFILQSHKPFTYLLSWLVCDWHITARDVVASNKSFKDCCSSLSERASRTSSRQSSRSYFLPQELKVSFGGTDPGAHA